MVAGRLGILLLALLSVGCVSYRDVRTEKIDTAVVTEQERRIAELERRQESLLAGYASLVEEADRALALWVERGYTEKPVMMEGKVTAVDLIENVVTLSFGAGDEPSQGTEFMIYAGDRFVGKVVLELARGSWGQGYSMKEFEARPIEVGQEARHGRRDGGPYR